MSVRRWSSNPGLMHQGGAALILCLMLLGAISLLGLSAATGQVMQLRMSHNLDAGLERRIGADAALNWAEDWLMGQPGSFRPPDCSSDCASEDMIGQVGLYGPAPQFMDLEWWQTHGHATPLSPEAGAEVDELQGPWFLIEEVHVQASANPESPVHETAYYRITARARDHGTAQTGVVESLLARPWGEESLSDGFPASAGVASFCQSAAIDSPCGRLAWRSLKQ